MSPIEHELVCPNGHDVEIFDGRFSCVHETDPPDLNSLEPNPCEGVTYEMKDLIRSGRTRRRQFAEDYARAARSGVWPDMATRDGWAVVFR